MSRGQAQTMQKNEFDALIGFVYDSNKDPLHMRVAFLLSFTAGLRVAEIAGLRWRNHVLGPDGEIMTNEFLTNGSKGRKIGVRHPVILVGKDIGKYGRKRTIRAHPTLVLHLKELLMESDPDGYVIPSGRGGAGQSVRARAHALKMRLNRIYQSAGYTQCSTHTGRRTAITSWARKANLYNASMVDVQTMAGHGDLTTTQAYVEVSDQQSDLVVAGFG